MKNAARAEILQVVTQGVRGGKQHVTKQGMVRLVCSKGFNEPQHSIEVDVFSGTGNNLEHREDAAVCIKLKDGFEWNGTFSELAAILKRGRAAVNVGVVIPEPIPEGGYEDEADR